VIAPIQGGRLDRINRAVRIALLVAAGYNIGARIGIAFGFPAAMRMRAMSGKSMGLLSMEERAMTGGDSICPSRVEYPPA
jgi:hypothetical protein